MIRQFKLQHMMKASTFALGVCLVPFCSSNAVKAQSVQADAIDTHLPDDTTWSVDGQNGFWALNHGLIDGKSGNLSVSGDYVHGLKAETAGQVNLGNFNISTSGLASHGASVSGAGSKVFLVDTTIVTTGQEANGVFVENAGQAELKNITIKTGGWNSVGVSGTGAGSTITVSGSIETNGEQSSAVMVDNHATAKISDLKILTTDRNADSDADYQGLSFGLNAQNNASMEVVRAEIITQGKKGVGVLSSDAGQIKISDSSVTTAGNDSYALTAMGTGSKIDATNLILKTSGNQSIGMNITDGGSGTLNKGTIITTGVFAHGIKVYSASAQAQNVDIITSGEQSIGIFSEGSGSQILANHINITTTGNLGHGVLVMGGAANLEDITISSTGSQSFSLWASGNASSITGKNITAVSQGWHGYGAYADNLAQIDLSNVTLETNFYDTAGLYATTGGSLNIDHAQVTANGYYSPALATVNGGIANITASLLSTKGTDSPALLMQSNNGVTNIIYIDQSELRSPLSVSVMVEQGDAELTLVNSTATVNNGQWLSVGVKDATMSANARVALDGSTVSGVATTYEGSQTHLSMANNAVWNVTGNSNLSELINNESSINFGHNQSTENGGSGFVHLKVSGDYRGTNGQIVMNTVLNDDSSPTDHISIGGNVYGTTAISIVNRGGMGAQTTGNGIELISVGGTNETDKTFRLNSDYNYKGIPIVAAGAYVYSLQKGGLDNTGEVWYLRSLYEEDTQFPPEPVIDPSTPVLGAGVPVYEVYPQILLELNKLGTLRQRVGNRVWANGQASSSQPNSVEQQGFWMKVDGSTAHINPDISSANTNYNIDMVRTQLGLDFLAKETENGSLIGGAYFVYGHAKGESKSRFGQGTILSDGYGLGGTLTWYGNNDFYVDAQAQLMWFDSDLYSRKMDNGTGFGKKLVDGNDGFGYALSIEAGRQYTLNAQWTMTPQVQLSYQSIDFDSFNDLVDARISLRDGDSLLGRAGISFDRETTWKSQNGDMRRMKLYGLTNLYYEFLDGSAV